MPTRTTITLATILVMISGLFVSATVKQDESLETARQAYESSDYTRAMQILLEVAARSPQNAEAHLWLAKTYYEMQQHDAAIASAERAVALEPENSLYHEWLGRTYGEKASHAGWFSALSLAKKTRKEFEKAVELNEQNFSARQALIEFDCSAPGIVGGGEDKARPEIEKLATLDVAEGHYAAGNCRRQKKDFAAADIEFTKAIDGHPKSADLIYDIGDYAMKHSQPERLVAVANEGERVAPSDPRGMFYRAVALVLTKDRPADAERWLREYLKRAPKRNNFPGPHEAHEWLGRLYESQGTPDAAIDEYEAALKLDSKSKVAHEALKRLKKSS